MKRLITTAAPTHLARAAKKCAVCWLPLVLALLAGPAMAQSVSATNPSVATLEAQSITAVSAVLRGSISNDGGSPVLERQIEWTRKSRPWGTGAEGVDFGIIADSAITVTNDTEFSAIETRLRPGTAYRYRVFARNEIGWSDTNAVNIQNFVTAKRVARISLQGPLDFGTVGVGLGQSAIQTLIISNAGNAPLMVSGIVVPKDFAATFTGAISANESAVVTVTFTPTSARTFLGKLTVKSDATSGTNTISLSGTATNLAPLPTATTSPAKSLTPGSAFLSGTIDSDGGVPILERQIRWAKHPGPWATPNAGADFGIITTVSVSNNTFSATERRLAPNTTYKFMVEVRNAGGWADPVNVEYFTTPPITRLISLSGDLAFGTVAVGELATRTFTISNSGNSSLNVGSITLPEGFTSDFSGAVAPTNSVDVVVAFAPPAGGPFGGTLSVKSDATSGKTNSFVSGTGDAGPPVPVAIVEHPESVVALRKQPVDFSVATAGGQGTLTFQWLFNGTSLSRATSPLLHFSHVQPLQAGTYSVVVSDGVTSVVSSNATLHVIDIRIVRSPRDHVVRAGHRATFYVTAVGPAPLTYQWFHNGTPIDGATSRTLIFREVQAENAGSYSVQVSNLTGTTETRAATLQVR